jgi:hypothetical protein
MRKLWIGIAALTAAIVLTAGACEDRGTRDAPIDTRLQDNTAPYIVNMPDQYANLALKCLGNDLLVSHTREAPPLVVEDADACVNDSDVPRVNLDISASANGEGG